MKATRRMFAKRLGSALFDRRAPLLGAMPGMLSAGFIVRRGRGMRRRIDGMALHAGGRWAAFDYDQPFRVASVSKMVTATGFMALVAQRGIDLDADASNYLGAPLRHPLFAQTAITARMLLSHTSGLRNGDDFPVPFNRPLLARLSAAAGEERYGGWWAPANEPPGWFSYSDTNFAVAAQIIECVTQQRFDHFMRERLFEPLDLDIGYNWSGVSQRKRDGSAAGARWLEGAWTAEVDANPPQAPAPALYRGDGDPNTTDADYQLGENGFAFAPHGGLRLSLADMDRLARFFLRGAPRAGAGALTQMSAPTWTFDPAAPNGATGSGWYQSFGLGVHLLLGRDASGASPGDAFFGADSSNWRGHFGDAYGWITGLLWNPRENATLVYAINGMPETDRPPGARSAMSAPEEVIIDAALAAIG